MHSTTNNAHGSTGPTTEAGKARSSRNATKNGLFSVGDLILDSESQEYAQTMLALYTQLSPDGVLEETFVDEIMTGYDLLFRARDRARLYEVSTEARKTLLQQLLSGLGTTAQKAADAVIARLAAH